MLDNREDIDSFSMALASAAWAHPVSYIAKFGDDAPPEEILFRTAPVASGHVLVARSERIVASIVFGRTEDEALLLLAKHFPEARLVRDDLNSCRVIANVLALVENPLASVSYDTHCSVSR